MEGMVIKMIKGCQKNVIWLRNTESELFEQAYFILSDAACEKNKSEGDILAEARRIISDSPCGNYWGGYAHSYPKKKRKRPSGVVRLAFFMLGLVAGALPAIAVFWHP